MPHKQKENHNHSTRSKKERQEAKQQQIARKKSVQAARESAELEAAAATGLLKNNLGLTEGFAEYEVNCKHPRDTLDRPVRIVMYTRMCLYVLK